MTLYAYCIHSTGAPSPSPALRGLGGAQVRVVEEAKLRLWVSALEEVPPADPPQLREHDCVVRSALRTATPLPLRFGTLFADEAAALAVLRARRDDFAASLSRVEGRVEIGVTLLWDSAAQRTDVLTTAPALAPSIDMSPSGRAYLEARGREIALESALATRASAFLDEVAELLAASAGDAGVARSVRASQDAAGTLAYLVRREAVLRFRNAAEALSGSIPGIEPRVSGPWAPYSFV